MMLQILVVPQEKRQKTSTVQTLQQTCSTAVTHKCRFLIRGAFVYIAGTVIPLVRPTLRKDLAALCLIISANANPFYTTRITLERKRENTFALRFTERCLHETLTSPYFRTCSKHVH